jgi:hypothetical protein
MAEIDRGDRQIADHVTQLRGCVTTMRSKAGDLEGFVHAEQSRRIRMEDYLAHWVKTSLWWKYEEVWSGQVRVRDMNEGLEVSTSDEEALEAQDNCQACVSWQTSLVYAVVLMQLLPLQTRSSRSHCTRQNGTSNIR